MLRYQQAVDWFRRTQTVLLPLMTTVIAGSTFLVLRLFENVRFKPAALAGLAVMAAIGLGLDLRTVRTARFLGVAVVFSITLSVVVALAVWPSSNPGPPIVGHLLLGLEMFAPLFFISSVASRWYARREARREFERGTARFNPGDVEHRKKLIDAFKRRGET